MHVEFMQRKYPNIYVQGFYVARGRVERMLIQSNSDPTTTELVLKHNRVIHLWGHTSVCQAICGTVWNW
jgi:hypothetical protein